MVFPSMALVSSVASDPYRSVPLPRDSTCIRLLSVPIQENDDGPIEGVLHVANLHEDPLPKFSALSYVWGEQLPRAESKIISTTDGSIPITENCHRAIINLRKKLGGFTIWIDAVCINQNDTIEKQYQMSLMKEVYTKAAEVYVCLGESNPAMDKAMKYLSKAGLLDCFFVNGEPSKLQEWTAACRAFFVFLDFNQRVFPFYPSKYWRVLLCWKPRFVGVKRADLTTHKDLSGLLTTEWTTRIWTYQEIILATNPIMVCGDHHIKWPQFSYSITFLHHISEGFRSEAPMTPIIAMWSNILDTKDNVISYSDASVADRRAKYEAFLNRVARKYKLLVKWGTMISILFLIFTLCLVPDFWYTFLYFNAGWEINHISIFYINNTVPSSLLNYNGAVFNITIGLQGTLYPNGTFDGIYNGTSVTVLDQPSGELVALRAFLFSEFKEYYETKRPHILPNSYIPVAIISVLLLLLCGFNLLNWSVARVLPFKISRRDQAQIANVQMDEDKSNNLVDAICSRKATNAWDMAFGLRAVLGILINQDLPPPDYSMPLGEIYKELTAHLLQATGTLFSLIPAALTDLPGQPSWVPNWKTDLESQIFWLRQVPPRFTLHLPDGAAREPADRWTPNLQDGTLTVHGRTLCIVGSLLKFHKTDVVYHSGQDDKHKKNLKTIQALLKPSVGGGLVRGNLLNRTNHPSVRNDLVEADFDGYLSTLLWSNRLSLRPSTLLFIPKCIRSYGIFKRVFWRPLKYWNFASRTLDVHIWLCNSMARTKRRVFLAENGNTLALDSPRMQRLGWWELIARGTRQRLGLTTAPIPLTGRPATAGICTVAVRVGDRVVLLDGLSMPLIIRRVRLRSPLFRIVSPAIVQSWAASEDPKSFAIEGDLEEFIIS